MRLRRPDRRRAQRRPRPRARHKEPSSPHRFSLPEVPATLSADCDESRERSTRVIRSRVVRMILRGGSRLRRSGYENVTRRSNLPRIHTIAAGVRRSTAGLEFRQEARQPDPDRGSDDADDAVVLVCAVAVGGCSGPWRPGDDVGPSSDPRARGPRAPAAGGDPAAARELSQQKAIGQGDASSRPSRPTRRRPRSRPRQKSVIPKWVDKFTLFGDVRIRHEGFYNQPAERGARSAPREPRAASARGSASRSATATSSPRPSASRAATRTTRSRPTRRSPTTSPASPSTSTGPTSPSRRARPSASGPV